jgi:hypothetical protein
MAVKTWDWKAVAECHAGTIRHQANEIAVLRAEIEQLRTALREARDVAALDGLTQWVEFFDRHLEQEVNEVKS